MSTVAQWSSATAAAANDVTAEMTDMEAHIQQTNDRLLCIQQVSGDYQKLLTNRFCFFPRPLK